MIDHSRPIERHGFEIAQLNRDHPPHWGDRNKQLVYEIACPSGSVHEGQLEYSRWAAMPLPEAIDARSAANRSVDRPGFYDYAPEPDLPGAVEWHVNLADALLFGYYASGLFAQDEMQVAEHPALASLKEALPARYLRGVTVENRVPTPVLVVAVPRRCRIATEPDAAQNRPYGLYGNAFARASPDAIRRATERIEPPTITNIVAMAARSGGCGRYRAEEIEHVLVTAFTAFRAVAVESAQLRGADCPIVVHTGFWGCGAFGGDRVLMTTLQMLAGEMSGLDRIVFHTGDFSGAAAVDAARRVCAERLAEQSPMPVFEVLRQLDEIKFHWGASDGN